MSPAAQTTDTASHAGSAEALLTALSTERRLLDELKAALGRQRSAVGENDIEAIESGVGDVHRTLLTLDEALKRRRSLLAITTGSEETPLSEVPEIAQNPHGELGRVATELTVAAETVARELASTRVLLQAVIAEGHEYMRTLAGGELEATVYRRGDSEREPAPGGALLDQRI